MQKYDLEEIEKASVEFARASGKLLLHRINTPLQIRYKSSENRDPVSEADHESDKLLKREIQKKFPEHRILSEESVTPDQETSRLTWVLDPLDGTTNFINKLPVFAVSVAVLDGNRPIAGSIFIPSVQSEEGMVFHASVGSGAKCDGTPIDLEGTFPSNRLVALPANFWSRMKPPLPGKPRSSFPQGEIRNTGSIAYELAMVTNGVFQYAVFNGPKIWDVAAGLLIVKESGQSVRWRPNSRQFWTEFTSFDRINESTNDNHESLRDWKGSIIAGEPTIIDSIAVQFPKRRVGLKETLRKIKSHIS